MKVTRLPKDPGPAAWTQLLPAGRGSPPLSEERDADWLVIGAGFAGLAAAQRLTQLCPAESVVILEASRVGDGPAGRNSGFMIDLPHDLASDDYGGALENDVAQTMDNRRAIAFAREMAQSHRLPAEAFQEVGKINGAATEKGHKHNQDYARHLRAMGEEHELLDAAAMHAITGTRYYRSGLKTPGTVMLQPAMFVRGVAKGLISNRISLFEESPVVELYRDEKWIARTPTGRVRAKKVILAVNGHLESFGFMRGRLVHVHTFASMTRALTHEEVEVLGGEANWGITPADPMGTTVRRVSGVGGDRIVIRNRFSYDPNLEPGPKWQTKATEMHDRAFTARFPALSSVSMDYRWGGRLCLAQNNVQVIGEIDEGLFAACVQNGLGTAKGTLAGLLAAEDACGVASPALQRAKTAPGPSRLPPRPIAQIGAFARLKWGEWQAGKEI